MAILKAVRGTRDLLPPETALWNHVEATARAVFARYGFGEIRTPIFEDTALFARGVGEETDIVSKEMYTWEDGGRPETSLLRSRWTDEHPQYPLEEPPIGIGNIQPFVSEAVIASIAGERTFIEFRVLPPKRVDGELFLRRKSCLAEGLAHLVVVPRSEIDNLDLNTYEEHRIKSGPVSR